MRPAFARSAGHQARACIARCAFDRPTPRRPAAGASDRRRDSIAARDPKGPLAAGTPPDAQSTTPMGSPWRPALTCCTSRAARRIVRSPSNSPCAGALVARRGATGRTSALRPFGPSFPPRFRHVLGLGGLGNGWRRWRRGSGRAHRNRRDPGPQPPPHWFLWFARYALEWSRRREAALAELRRPGPRPGCANNLSRPRPGRRHVRRLGIAAGGAALHRARAKPGRSRSPRRRCSRRRT